MSSDTADVLGMVPSRRHGAHALFGLHRRVRMGLLGQAAAGASVRGTVSAASESSDQGAAGNEAGS